MMRKGIRPNGASPASRASERVSAGLMEPTNSSQREDHFTSNFGVASRVWTVSSSSRVGLMREADYNPWGGLSQLYRRRRFLFRPPCHTGVPVLTRHYAIPG